MSDIVWPVCTCLVELLLYNEKLHLKKICCHLFVKVLLISNLINMNVHVARHVEQNDQNLDKIHEGVCVFE